MRQKIRVIALPTDKGLSADVLAGLMELVFETTGKEVKLSRDGVYRIGPDRVGGYIVPSKHARQVLRDTPGYRDWCALLNTHTHIVIPADVCVVVTQAAVAV